MADVTVHNSPVRVLLVDDYEPWRVHTRSTLQTMLDLQVVGEAVDGLEAIQIAQELGPDLVLLDLGLPSLNGIEVAYRLCKSVPDTKVLFLTQEEDAEVAREALTNGAKGYVLKSDAGTELLPAIEAVLRGEAFVSSQVRDKV
jgi:DNA-binding NarL/FixJ family response regulator